MLAAKLLYPAALHPARGHLTPLPAGVEACQQALEAAKSKDNSILNPTVVKTLTQVRHRSV